MKRVLILGAGFLQSFVIKKAKELGYYTIVLDNNPESLGFKYADEFEVINIVDQEACLNYAKEKRIDGVMTAATDYGVLSAAYISDKLNLPGINYKSAELIKNKHSVRRLFFENNIDDISQYYEVGSIQDIDEVVRKVKYPVMVKPSDGSGSKAAKRVDIQNELAVASIQAIDASLINKALIEDFVIGKEYGVESFVYQDNIYVLGILNKEMTNPPFYAELGHSMPSGLSLNIEKKIKRIVKNAIEVLEINFGAVNMDILVTDKNEVSIIDVGARMGGNLIGSHIIPNATGYDYLGNLIKATVDDEVLSFANNQNSNVVTKLLALNPGKIVKLPDFNQIEEENKVDIYFNKKIEDTINEYHDNLDGCGYVLCIGPNLKENMKRSENAKNQINQRIHRVKKQQEI